MSRAVIAAEIATTAFGIPVEAALGKPKGYPITVILIDDLPQASSKHRGNRRVLFCGDYLEST